MSYENVQQEQVGIDAETCKEVRRVADGSLYFFAKGILGYDWLTPHIHLPVCRLLENWDNKRLKITLPRGWLKSTIGTISMPIHAAAKDPNLRFLIVQNTFDNAAKKLAEIRGHWQGNVMLRACYPDVRPGRIWKTDAACLTRTKDNPEATFECAGTSTRVTSRHYDCIVEDDTVAPDLSDLGIENLAPTKEQVANAIGYHRLVLPLLVDPSKSRNIVIGTRWFIQDLLSWIGDNEPYFISYSRACRESEGAPDEFGDITYPERFSEEVLAQLKTSMGPYMFSCLYLNKPLSSEQMVFLPEWIQFYSTEPQNLMVWTTVDLAGDPQDSKGNPDYNVVITCGKDIRTGIIYVLDLFRERCNPSRVIDTIFNHVNKWKPLQVGIESVAYQKSLLYWIRERQRKNQEWFNVEPMTWGKKSKHTRISGLQPIAAAGKLMLRSHHVELYNELVQYPLSTHDDCADALSMQLQLWRSVTAEEEKPSKELDPFSLESAIAELKSRRKDETPLGCPMDLEEDYLSVGI